MSSKKNEQLSWEIERVIPGSMIAKCFSPSNIALAKYWGKRDVTLNLPANGSISLTLQRYGSFTTVEFSEAFQADRLILNGKEEVAGKLGKVKIVLDDLREKAGTKDFARVQSYNNFPTGAGLASSASGLSAVAFAGASALNLKISRMELSGVARKGSGSACRSLFGGFVEWKRGERADGSDSVAELLAPPSHWPLKCVLAIANQAQKHHASTGGMEHTRQTSPYFPQWVEAAQKSVAEIRQAIETRDFLKLAELSEANCTRMHTSAMAAQPPVFYWQPATVELIQRIWSLRASGVPVFFTIDAGPNVVAVCEQQVAQRVAQELLKTPGTQILQTELGEGSRLFDVREWEGVE